MKNKILTYCLLALTAISLSVVSCQRDDLKDNGTNGEVTISVVVPNAPTVRSAENPGDGTLVNRCILEIYENDELYGERMYADITPGSLTAQFSARLVTDHTYTFVFWADHAEGSAETGYTELYYNTENGLSDIKLITNEYVNNNDERDAFYLTESKTITSAEDLNFTLRRPSGQVNLVATDLTSLPSDFDFSNITVKVGFTEVPAGFNALTGEITEERTVIDPVSFSVPVDFPAVGETPADEARASFDYIFANVGADQTLLNFTYEFQNNGTAISTGGYDNFPILQNYRTNLRGALFTDGVEITVNIDPIIIDPENPQPGELVEATIAEFLAAEVSTDTWYKLTGTITNIENTTYGNFTIKDETGSVYIYGLTEEKQDGNDKSFINLGLQVNDIVTLATVRGEHNGEAQGGGSTTPAYYISHERPEQPEIPEGDPTALIISEYSEGASFNKFLEITNISDKDIDLSAYLLRIYTNGNESSTNQVQLSGTLAAGASKVYKNSKADATLPDGVEAEAIDDNVINFNGNDPMAIICNNEIADLLGEIGSSADFGKDVTLRRLSTVTAPTATYNTEEWETLGMDDLTGFGSHGGEAITELYPSITKVEGEYWGTANSENANYKVVFTDEAEGHTYTIDIYGKEWPNDGSSIGIQSATYTMSETQDEYNTFYSANSYYSNLTEGIDKKAFTSGTLNITYYYGSYHDISLEFVIDGVTHHVNYYGDIVLENKGPVTPPAGFENNVTMLSDYIMGLFDYSNGYQGIRGDLYCFRIELNDYNGSGYNAYLDLVTKLDADGHIANGTYNAGENAEEFTLLIGEDRSYCNYTDLNWNQTNAQITGGTVTVSSSGIEMNVTVTGGSTVTASWSGSLPYTDITDNFRFPTAKSTVTGPVDASYSGDVNANGYGQSDCYRFNVGPTYGNQGPALYFDIVPQDLTFGSDISGTYTCSNTGEAGTFFAGAIYANGSDYDYWGTVYFDMVNAGNTGTYATINGGTLTIDVTNTESNEWGDMLYTCNITLNGFDTNGEQINVSYTDIVITCLNQSTTAWYSRLGWFAR